MIFDLNSYLLKSQYQFFMDEKNISFTRYLDNDIVVNLFLFFYCHDLIRLFLKNHEKKIIVSRMKFINSLLMTFRYDFFKIQIIIE